MTTRRRRTDRGALALETVMLTPVLLAAVLTIAGASRMVDAQADVTHTAAVAARAASLTVSPDDAQVAAELVARDALREIGRSCTGLSTQVDVRDFRAGGTLTVRVRCTVGLSDLAGFGFPGARTFASVSVVPVEEHRVMS